jgi:hypothetical protein
MITRKVHLVVAVNLMDDHVLEPFQQALVVSVWNISALQASLHHGKKDDSIIACFFRSP